MASEHAQMMTNDYPDDPTEVYWMLLTFMTLPADEQLRHLQYVPSRTQPDLLESHHTNPLLALAIALQTFGWRDEFEPDVHALDDFQDALQRLAVIDNIYLFCREEFSCGFSWEELRELARAALSESGMGPHPVPEVIDFHELIEFT